MQYGDHGLSDPVQQLLEVQPLQAQGLGVATPLGQQLVDIHACDAVALGRFDTEGFAVKIEVKPAGRSFTRTAIKSQLIGQIAVGFTLESVTEAASLTGSCRN